MEQETLIITHLQIQHRHRLMNTSYHTIKHKSDGTATVSLEGWFNVKVLNWSGVNVSEICSRKYYNKIIRGIDNSSVKFKLWMEWGNRIKKITFTKLSSTARVES